MYGPLFWTVWLCGCVHGLVAEGTMWNLFGQSPSDWPQTPLAGKVHKRFLCVFVCCPSFCACLDCMLFRWLWHNGGPAGLLLIPPVINEEGCPIIQVPLKYLPVQAERIVYQLWPCFYTSCCLVVTKLRNYCIISVIFLKKNNQKLEANVDKDRELCNQVADNFGEQWTNPVLTL